MNNRQTGLMAAGLIALGCVSAVGLAFELQPPRPAPLLATEAPVPERVLAVDPATNIRAVPEPEPVAELAPVRIVGHITPRFNRLVQTASTAPADKPMRCTGWRPLLQGSEAQSVRLCD